MSKVISIEDTIKNWQKHRSGHTPPFRFELGKLDSNIQFILSYNDENEITIKRAGMYFERLFGAILQGRSFTSLFMEDDNLTQLKNGLKSVFETPAITHIELSANDVTYEIVLLPVRSDHGPLEVALGAINLDKLPTRSVVQAEFLGCKSERLIQHTEKRLHGFAAPKSSFQGKSSPFKVIEGSGNKRPIAEKPNLNILHSFKREP